MSAALDLRPEAPLARGQVVGQHVALAAPPARSGCRRSGPGWPTPRPAPRCSRWPGRSRCGACPRRRSRRRPPRARATASRTRASTPGSMPSTKYWRGRPRRSPRKHAAASSSSAGSARRSPARQRRGGRIALVATGHGRQQQRGVTHVAPERPHLVERRGEGDDAVAADATVRGLAGRRCRSARPAGGWSRRCRCRWPAGTWKAATAAAEPPDEPPGTRDEVPRIGGRARSPSAPWTSPWRTRPCWSCRR